MLIFDLDDTLIPTSSEITPKRLESALKAMIKRGLTLSFEEAMPLLSKINSQEIRSKDALERFSFEVTGSKEMAKFGLEDMLSPMEGYNVSKLNELNQFLSDLKTTYKLAIVTGGDKRVQEEKISLFGIDKSLFEEIVVTDLGEKELAYKSLSQKHGAFLVVGDRIEYDLSAAKRLGGKTVHIRQGRGVLEPKNHPNVDYEIKTIKELKEVLKRL